MLIYYCVSKHLRKSFLSRSSMFVLMTVMEKRPCCSFGHEAKMFRCHQINGKKRMGLRVNDTKSLVFARLASDLPPSGLDRRSQTFQAVHPTWGSFLKRLNDKFGSRSLLGEFYLSCIRVKKTSLCLYPSMG